MKDERFKNAGETVWVWDNGEQEKAERRKLIAQNEDGSCYCICSGDERCKQFEIVIWKNYSFTDPNQKEYEPYGEGEMPRVDKVVCKDNGVEYLVTTYDPKNNCQLFFGDRWRTNQYVFEHYTDLNGNPIGKEKR